MKSFSSALISVALALVAGVFINPAHAQTPAGVTAQAASADMSEGEVRKVDKENKKITLKHGAIKNLDMPGMTMVFQVTDPALLDKVQAGDKVHFAAVNDGGKLTVTRIEVAK
jgi:Cu(I)/Ag(I) efflux system periplasmic protein CusF